MSCVCLAYLRRHDLERRLWLTLSSCGRQDTPSTPCDTRRSARSDPHRARRGRRSRWRRCGRATTDRADRRAREVADFSTSVSGMPACASSSSSRTSEMPWNVTGLPASDPARTGTPARIAFAVCCSDPAERARHHRRHLAFAEHRRERRFRIEQRLHDLPASRAGAHRHRRREARRASTPSRGRRASA